MKFWYFIYILHNIYSLILFFRHQGPAFDHECYLWLWPHQSDQLHGARSHFCLPTHQIQRWLGCQAYLDPPLLHAFLCRWYWAEAGAATTLKERVTHGDLEEMSSKLSAFSCHLCVILMQCSGWLQKNDLLPFKIPIFLIYTGHAMIWCRCYWYLYVHNLPCVCLVEIFRQCERK